MYISRRLNNFLFLEAFKTTQIVSGITSITPESRMA